MGEEGVDIPSMEIIGTVSWGGKRGGPQFSSTSSGRLPGLLPLTSAQGHVQSVIFGNALPYICGDKP